MTNTPSKEYSEIAERLLQSQENRERYNDILKKYTPDLLGQYLALVETDFLVNNYGTT